MKYYSPKLGIISNRQFPWSDHITYYTLTQTNGSNGQDCDICDGSGIVDCPECDGRKVIRCRDCNGDGENLEGGACGTCQGGGTVRCDICDGDGEVGCPECS